MAGMTVTVRFTANSIFGSHTATYPNITEVHYLYPMPFDGKRIAFESDIDHTGYTHDVVDIAEMEIVPQAEQESGQ